MLDTDKKRLLRSSFVNKLKLLRQNDIFNRVKKDSLIVIIFLQMLDNQLIIGS